MPPRPSATVRAYLQAALSTCARLVSVPSLPAGRSWIVRPLEITCDGQTVDLATDAVLQAQRGEYHVGEGHILLTVKNRTNVTVRGNGGATIRMWRDDYNNASWYKHSEGQRV